jgi:hypothetical protein
MYLDKKTAIIKELIELLNESSEYVWDLHNRELCEKITTAVNYAKKSIEKETKDAEQRHKNFIDESGKSTKNICNRKILR